MPGSDRLLDAYATRPQYIDHLAPVLRELPEALLHVPTQALATWAHGRGVSAVPGQPVGDKPVLVAAHRDELAVGGPIVLLEHGAGQHYGGVDASGEGVNRPQVILYLAPNGEVADRMEAVVPRAERVVVGCPRLDRFAAQPKVLTVDGPPLVGFVWHWPSRTWPESHWAFPHYRRALTELHLGWPLLGHGHPRGLSHLAGHYRRAGIPVTSDVEEVLDRVDLVVADNSSVMWEAAAIGIPLVILDAPEYRRGVHHGLRFWTWADIGPRIGPTDDLGEAITRGWERREAYAPLREAMTVAVYGKLDGLASARSAAAIRERIG